MPVEMEFGVAETVISLPEDPGVEMEVVSAAAWARERVDLFGPTAQGKGEHGLAHRFHGTGGWSQVELVSARPPLFPQSYASVCSWGEGRLDLVANVTLDLGGNQYARGVGHTWFDAATGWGSWDFLAGPPDGGSLEIVAGRAGRLDVLTWTPTECFHLWFEEGHGWSSWEAVPDLRLPGAVGRVVVCAPAPGVIDVFGAEVHSTEAPKQGDLLGNPGPVFIPDAGGLGVQPDPEQYVWDGLWHAGYRADGPLPGWFGWERMPIPGIDGNRFCTLAAVPDTDAPDIEIAGARNRPRPGSAVLIAGVDLVMRARFEGATWVPAPVAARGKYFGSMVACATPDGARCDLFVNKVDEPAIYHYWSDDARADYHGPEWL